MKSGKMNLCSVAGLTAMTLLWTSGCRSEPFSSPGTAGETSANSSQFTETRERTTELSENLYTDRAALEMSVMPIESRETCQRAFAELDQKPFPESPYGILTQSGAGQWVRTLRDSSLGDIRATPVAFRILRTVIRTYLVRNEDSPEGLEMPEKQLLSETVEVSCPLPVSWEVLIPGFEIAPLVGARPARVCPPSSLDPYFPGKCTQGYDLTSALIRWREEFGETCTSEVPGAACKGDDFSNSRHYLPLALKAVPVDDAQGLRDQLLLGLGLPAGTPARVQPASSRFNPHTRNTPLRVIGFADTEKGVPSLWLGTRDTCARSGRGCDRILPFNQEVRAPQARDLASPEKLKEFLETFQQVGIGLFNLNPWNATTGSYPAYYDGSLAHINEISARLNALLAGTWDRKQPVFMSLVLRFEEDGPVFLQKLRVHPEGEAVFLGGPERLSTVKQLGLNVRAL